MGTLYVVATPIGNLEDITFRAVRILREVSLIAAEDTRTSRVLLQHYDVAVPMTSYFEHNKLVKQERVLAALALGDVALISDAGTPAISDPGVELVRAALEAGHAVVPVPGPSAALAALSVAGLPTERFTFLGFLPRREAALRAALEPLVGRPETLLFYEAPHRIRATVSLLAELFGPERPIVLARELTKRYEELWRGPLAEAVGHLALTEPRGEFTVLLGGADAPPPDEWADDEVQRLLLALQGEGITGSRAVKEVVRLSGRPRSEIYDLWLQLHREL